MSTTGKRPSHFRCRKTCPRRHHAAYRELLAAIESARLAAERTLDLEDDDALVTYDKKRLRSGSVSRRRDV